MPELLLSLPTEQVEDLHKASADLATAEIWRSLWREQHPAATATVCFPCDQPVPFPPVGVKPLAEVRATAPGASGPGSTWTPALWTRQWQGSRIVYDAL